MLNSMITVFYDGKCSLCSKEIKYYRNIAPVETFYWLDITTPAGADELKKEGFSLSEGFKLLHAKDEEGLLHTGLDAFILIWQQLKGWKVLALFVCLPVIRQIASILYCCFARWRFKRLKHCQVEAEKEL